MRAALARPGDRVLVPHRSEERLVTAVVLAVGYPPPGTPGPADDLVVLVQASGWKALWQMSPNDRLLVPVLAGPV